MQRRFGPAALWRATLAAVIGALVGRECGIGAAAALALAALAIACVRPRWAALLTAVPAAFGALPLPSRAVAPVPAGPVAFRGVVTRSAGTTGSGLPAPVELDCGGGRVRLVVTPPRPLLPGDRVAGIARCPRSSAFGAHPAPLLEAAAEALAVRPGSWSLARMLPALRDRLQQELLQRVPDPSGAMLCQLVLGQGPPVDDALAAAHRATGLSHLLAVSGAHAAMLAFLLGLPFRRHGRRPVLDRRFRAVTAGALLAYGALTGFEPPMFRAVAAFLLWLWAARTGRRVPPGSLLAAPALLTALFAPEDLLSVSFALSYAAVAGLAIASGDDATHGPGLALRASFWAACTTSPLCVHLFGQLAPCTVLATPLLAPFVAAMLGLGLLVAALGPLLPFAADLLAVPVRLLAAGYGGALYALDLLPGTPIHATTVVPPLLLALTLLLAAGAALALGGRRGVAAFCALVILPAFVPAPAPAPRVDVLAVGHGGATLATLADGARVLVDCGSLADPGRAARAVEAALAPARRIDLLILSHADDDHTNGVPRLLRRVRIVEAWLPAHAAAGEAARALADAGTRLRILPPGRCRIAGQVQCEAPPAPPDRAANDCGLWTTLALPGCRLLLPGDAQSAAIDAWLATAPRGCDALVLPHHGRDEPRIEALLRAARPALAIVSNGDAEPAGTQLAAARRAGIEVVETGASGSVRIEPGTPARWHCARARPLRR